MGKMSELSMLLDEMIEAGRKMAETASAIKGYFASEPEHEAAKPELVPEKKPLSGAEVRTLLVQKSNTADGKYKPQVKALVRKYSDCGTFSDIKPDDYRDLVSELEVIGDA